ncbi:type IV pili methyl-accepting chemotaxis transducer N-terminal domain-containing protein [Aromatoleum diolicum]|uniref:NarX-like N-terminal domain-containing protein n=1 Tax=Aromatoleum diolicum TaxID=75796 RepID=A0ABX1QBF9_9RHOO|nr:type IV pili methyl-accepting chemotaxis transducer N-terminal domain-containing protein [Aromatoleum diolicum]NMG75727.1 hypothetical protein [Aromatoleum diolicum]
MLRKLSALLWAMCLAIAVHAAAPVLAPAASVNIAGEQRMLSQRLAKAYAQLGLNIVPGVAGMQVKESISRFEANLDLLRPGVASVAEAAPIYKRLVQEWSTLRAAAVIPVTRDSALAVSQRSQRVLDSAEQLTQALSAASGDVGRRVDLAGRQRMLSQRLVKAYMLQSWGVDSRENRHEMDAAAREFSEGLVALAALPDNTAEMRVELEEIALQWEWLQTALAVEGATSYRLVVAEAGDSILIAADRLTRLYEQSGVR